MWVVGERRAAEGRGDTSERARYISMMGMLTFENDDPSPESYFGSKSVVPDKKCLTIPKLVMADGDRGTKKRKGFGLEEESGKGKGIDNQLDHRYPQRVSTRPEVSYPVRCDTPVV